MGWPVLETAGEVPGRFRYHWFRMYRRHFLASVAAAAIPSAIRAAVKPDFTLHIAPTTFEIAPRKMVKTIAYNGQVPGPLLRMKEGREVTIEVFNDTGDADIVHWHGLQIPSAVDGATEEGTPLIPARQSARYTFTPRPGGTRWYHSHVMAGRNLKRATYTGQFGFFYIDPSSEPGNYDQEVFLALKEWDPYMSSGGDGGDDSIDVAYNLFSINDRALGHAEPIRVKQGQRVLLRILNASATITRRIAVAGHKFRVIAMDGNPVAVPKEVGALELGPAERIDAIVEMNQPGVWILGATDDHDREHGMGIVIEYAGQSGEPRWTPPSQERWDYTVFGNGHASQAQAGAAERVPLVFEKKFAGHHWVDKWTINGKEFPKTDPIRVKANGRYRLVFDNRSNEAHPVHLHRHTFELTKIAGVPTSGVHKDVVVVAAMSQTEVDLVANNPGLTLFHCHQQMHMDYGFMTLMEYVG
jgi:FtsP/CotA-like multicopper oxidase with cupredoxin domain